ncbi:sphingomyelin phosphodiesterase 2 [Aplysia californica]|uniref:sphingomyelin phosphodiesterase n=1 Tax=Aplysia californica TaxID=6500 RepID=A0ABM0JMY8_APLCA|nr:sphingomyelin phosphodiesterase 2 [Aplysia californica]
MTTELKIFTLNCWGLPFPVICKNRPERINAIGDYLKNGDFDVVFLQEIWVKSDFHILREKMKHTLPFSHYFYSGAIGSGLCVFSKHAITETFYHRYHLNGHAHKIFHGDWFGGKGVGLCRIHKNGIDINLYCSHFHAEYNPLEDEYRAHRLSQALELSQFIGYTSVDCDLIILAGDLNTPAHGLGYKVITQNGSLKDTWLEKKNCVENEDIGTCDVAGNCYTPASLAKERPLGDRIDYVMYSCKSNFSVEVRDCQLGGLGKIPGHNVNYSDHEPVVAHLTVGKHGDRPPVEKKSMLSRVERENLQECLVVLDKGVSQCLREEKFFQLVVFLLSLILYTVNSYTDLTWDNSGIMAAISMGTAKLSMAIGIGFCVWISLIVKRGEFHGLVACKEDVLKLLRI